MLTTMIVLLLAQAPPSRASEMGVPLGKGTTAPKVTLTSPRGGWTSGRMMEVKGTISDKTVDPITLSINGDRYYIRTNNGAFSRKFPAASGKNVITAMATNKGGTGTAQTTTYAQIPAVPLRVVLTSDTDNVWTDLHIYEPTDQSATASTAQALLQSTAHVYWANTESPSGGTFYLNEEVGGFDRPGYGPYLYVHRAPPKGLYLITANYWPSGDKSHTRATLAVTLYEGTAQEMKRSASVPLATPGTTAVMAWLYVAGPGEATIFVPSQEPYPQSGGWPKYLKEATELAKKGFSSGGDDEGGYD